MRSDAVTTWESLFRAQVSVMRHLNAEFPTDRISLNEYDVLFNVSKGPDRSLPMREINRHVLLSQPSVSRLVDRLVARGLLAKGDDPRDARAAIVSMTPAGLELFRDVAQTHMASIRERVGEALDPDELEHLRRLSDKLRGGADPASRPQLG